MNRRGFFGAIGQFVLAAAAATMIEPLRPLVTRQPRNPFEGIKWGTFKVKMHYGWLAGNLDMMGGLSPQSHTATQ